MASTRASQSASVPRELPPLRPVDIGKAVYELVMKRLPGTLDGKVEALGGSLAKELREALSAEFKAVVREEMEELEKDYGATRAALESSHEKRLGEIRLEYKDYEAKFLGMLNEARAIHQEGLAGMKGLMDKETGSAAWIGQMLRKELAEENAALTKSYEEKYAILENALQKSLVDTRAAVTSDLKAAFGKATEAATKDLTDAKAAFHKALAAEAGERVSAQAAALKALEAAFDKRLNGIADSNTKLLKEMRELLKSLPAPQASFTAPAVEVKSAPAVNNYTPPPVTVNVPAQPAPQVVVNFPRRKIVKHIIYDDKGQPSVIEETEVPLDEGKKK